MKIISLNTKKIYNIELPKAGENQMPCPDCSPDRKKPRAKPFSFNAEKKAGFCNHCLSKFAEYNTVFQKKEYKRPVWKNKTELTDGAAKWFEKRGISQEVVKQMKIYSDVEYMPQVEGETGVICFPYFLDDSLINIKFRDKDKNFKLNKDSELIFYNINCVSKFDSVVIVEGEMDCLSFIQSGIENCISVPNGASGTNLDYLDNYLDLFDKVKEIFICVDNDLKGYELRNELLRRFGQEKCRIVDLEDCKDANEYILKYGTNELKLKYESAPFLPIKDIIDIDDNLDDCYNLFINGMQKGKEIGLSDIDDLITWEQGRVVAVTGIPGHGKSELVDFIALKLCLRYGWKIGYFSPENFPFKYHFSKLSSKIIGKSFDAKYMNKPDFDASMDYVKDNISFVYPEDDMTFENIIEKATYLVKRNGIKQFIIDPYNKIEHLRNRGESETDYISRFLDKVCTFAKKYQILFWIVAHPRKMPKQKDDMAFEVPTLYDINGSANFYNKVDYGLTVYRNFKDDIIEVHVQKVKFKHLGIGGTAKLKYNFINGRFESVSMPDKMYDNKPYIDYEGRFARVESFETEKRVLIEPQIDFYIDKNTGLDHNGVDPNDPF